MNVQGSQIAVFPHFEQEILANGLAAYWVPDFEQATLTAAVQLPFGRFDDPVGLEGAGEFMVALMQKGTESFEQEDFSDQLERTGSSLFADVAEEHCIIGCRMLERHAETIMPLFWEMLTKPGFRDRELRMIKREVTTAMQAEYADPGSLVHHHFSAQLFGNGHPSGRNRTAASIKAITENVIRDFHRAAVRPSGASLVVAGAVQIASAQERWRELFESWAVNDSHKPSQVPQPSGNGAGTIVLVDKPDLTQTTLMVGHLVPAELSPERNALALANYVFGGGNFSSRLMRRVRSKMGKTYGISSQYLTTASIGLFSIATATRTAQTAEMLDMILDEYRLFCENGITADELATAQQYAAGSMAFQLEGIGNIAEKLLWLHLYERPVSYLESFAETVRALTLEDVNRAVRQHCSADYCAITAVGNRKELVGSIERFGSVKHVHYRSTPGEV